ncbi:MAG: NADPH-dependent FMN reductase [Halolamina sp.]
MTKVAAVVGSRREGSYTRAALRYALDGAERVGADTDLVDLGDPELDVPLYHPDRDAEEAGDVADLLARVRAADGVLLGTPVYHGSYSSTFRSFHDYCSFDEYEDTVVGLCCVAGGGTVATTLDHLRDTVRGVHGWTMPHQVGIRNASDRFQSRETAPDPDEYGATAAYELVDDGLRDRTLELGRRAAVYAARMPEFAPVEDYEW